MSNGVIATRRVVGGYANNQVGDEINRSRTQGQAPVLQKAIVVDIIADPSLLTEEEIQNLANRVNNPELVDILPINSIVAKIISNAQDISNPIETILFPFFSSNLMFPISPGEQVYVIYEDFSHQRNLVGFWLTRISEARTIEDVNYTHGDRRYLGYLNPQNLGTDQIGKQLSVTQSFPNGGSDEGTNTLRATGSNGENPYDGIVFGSKFKNIINFEPIPRYKKRPSDFVLQGKNNSLIVLGEDRPGSLTGSKPSQQAGCIDMVAGRSRILFEEQETNSGTQTPIGTSPRLIKNSRGFFETDKAPYLKESARDSINEGNPDYQTDAARILISMQANADIDFGLANNQNIQYPADTLPITQPKLNLSGTFGKSYVVGKADNIRFIARNDTSRGVSGSILLIREGASETDLGYLFINNNAELQLMAPKIYFGKATGESNNNEPPEPYIKWTEYQKTVNHLQKEIDDVRSALQSQLDSINTNFGSLITNLNTAFLSSIAIPYSPVTSLVTVGATILPLASTVQSAVTNGNTQATQAVNDGKSNTDTSVEDSKSERIFGE